MRGSHRDLLLRSRLKKLQTEQQLRLKWSKIALIWTDLAYLKGKSSSIEINLRSSLTMRSISSPGMISVSCEKLSKNMRKMDSKLKQHLIHNLYKKMLLGLSPGFKTNLQENTFRLMYLRIYQEHKASSSIKEVIIIYKTLGILKRNLWLSFTKSRTSLNLKLRH